MTSVCCKTRPRQLIDDQIKLSKLLDAPTPAQFYLVRGATAEAVLQREEALKQRLDPLIEKHLISGYQAMSNWVPSLRTQSRTRATDRTDKLLNDGGALADSGCTDRRRRRMDCCHARSFARIRIAADAGRFSETPASEPWRHLWLGQVDGGYASIVAVRGLSRQACRCCDRCRGRARWRAVGGQGRRNFIRAGRYRQYMGWVVLLSYFAVYGLLYPRYRGATWRVLAPTALASVATLALLGIAGQSLQLFHVLALMLLLGVGVDYGIFFQEHPSRRDPIAWLAVVLSALSTLLSFGLLGLSKTPALQAFGLTMLIGTGSVWFLAPCFARVSLERRTAIKAKSKNFTAKTRSRRKFFKDSDRHLFGWRREI